ncbi:amino acid adenylation domain-containing protein [Rhodoferax sp. GW822-FHT02A01]|uniref:non-ribosomal peptide synthetase n=1 Tax=Rhodoferax sp. GW822-FHT02A01 TaxID=3141537 RepID=UPI00315C6BF7
MEEVTANNLGSNVLPLSLSQREVWLDQRAWPGSTHLIIGGVAYLEGHLQVETLAAALKILVAESDAMRLVPNEDGTQVLLQDMDIPLDITTAAVGQDIHEAAQSWWKQHLQSTFSWSGRPPWQFGLIQGEANRNALVMQYHHLMIDGWGTARLIQRWSEIYNLLHQGKAVEPDASASYSSFVDDSNKYMKSATFESDGTYWLEQMPTLPPVLIDRRHSNESDSAALADAWLSDISLPLADYEKLRSSAAESGSTVFNYFLAAMAVYFARITNRQSVAIGVPNLNRAGKKFRNTLGMFVGVFPVNVTLTPGMTVKELLASIGSTMRGALRHSRYPLSEMGRALEVMRLGRDGIFDVLLSFERQDYDVAFGDAVMAESRQLFNGKARYPLGVTICEFQTTQHPEMVLEGSSACFSEQEVAQIGQRIWSLVLRMSATPDAPLDSLPLLSDSQHLQVRALHPSTQWNEGSTPYVTQFAAQAHANPSAVALVWDGGTMSYAELDQRSNLLARRLRALGATTDAVVALALPRSAELVVAVLAVSKAGAAFLPLDPDAPTARLADIVQESGALALVIQAQGPERLASLHAKTLVVSLSDPLDEDAVVPLAVEVTPESLAYVLFTSGSTGRPKGVMMSHSALAHRLKWLTKAYQVTPRDRSALSTQITFDPSLIELCLPLINGASVALPPPGRLLPETLAEFAIRHGATFIAFVPSTLTRFLDKAGGHPNLKLRVACCGGEVLPAELVNRYLSSTKARLFNVYGPTEACIFATAWECVSGPASNVLPIGYPVDDTSIYVLDSKLHQLPLGMHGQIFIGGAAVARGYLNRPDLDAQAFYPDPFRPGGRMYRTGDTGWFGEDGNLHFVGRLDRQIKLRGYRIELGEIEAGLLRVDGVTEAAVKVVQRGDKPVLHAWVSTSTKLGSDELQQALRLRVPDYMIPAGITILPELPMGDTGKIDYAALPEPSDLFVPQAARPPKNEMEQKLLAMWEDVLDVRPLSVYDNFFEVGGDSLDAVTILAGLEKMVGHSVPLFLLTENPTVEALAQMLRKPIEAPSSIVSFNANSNKAPFYIAASGHGDLIRFQALAQELQDIYDVRMLQPPLGQPISGVSQLAELYADIVESQDALPGFISGFSVGGITALETACVLQKRGYPLRGLILLDTLYPRAIWGGTIFWHLFVWLVRNFRLGDLMMNGRKISAMINDAALVGQVLAMAGYRAHRFEGRTLLVKTSGLSRWDWLFFAPWRTLQKGRLTESLIQGLHGSIFEADQIAGLARVLRGADQ